MVGFVDGEWDNTRVATGSDIFAVPAAGIAIDDCAALKSVAGPVCVIVSFVSKLAVSEV